MAKHREVVGVQWRFLMESQFVFHGVRCAVKGYVSVLREVWVWCYKLHLGEVFM